MNNTKYAMIIDQKSIMYNKQERERDGRNSRYSQMVNGLISFIYDNPKQKDQPVLFRINKRYSYEFTISTFVFHLILWYPNIEFNIKIDDNDMYDLHPLGKKKLNTILDQRIRKFVDLTGDIPRLDYIFSGIIQQLVNISDDYAYIACNTFSLFEMMRLEDINKTFSTLLNYGAGSVIHSISATENFLKVTAPHLLNEAIVSDTKNCLRPYIHSQRLNITQLVQSFVAITYRNSVSKEIIQHPITSNYVKGLPKTSDIFIEANSARMATIAKKKYVPKSGYFSRQTNLLCEDTMIDYTVGDCGTKHFVTIFIETQEMLNVIESKYRIDDNGELHEVFVTDTFLIGSTVKLRSHTVCALSENNICQTCFGAKAIMSQNINIGGLPAIAIVNPISQMGMSVKHQTSITSFKLDDPIMAKYFHFDGSFITVKEEYLRKISIRIPKTFIEEWVMDGGENIETEPERLPYFIIVDSVLGEEFLIQNDGILYVLDSGILKLTKLFKVDIDSTLVDDELYILPITNRTLNYDSPLFELIYITEEVSAHLSALEKIIVTTSAVASYGSIDNILSAFMKVVINAGISHRSTFIHMETIIYNMIKNVDNILKRPLFTKSKVNYQIVPMKKSIKTKDLCKGLSYEDIGRQLSNPQTYQKVGVSVNDVFFRNSLTIANGKGLLYNDGGTPKKQLVKVNRVSKVI